MRFELKGIEGHRRNSTPTGGDVTCTSKVRLTYSLTKVMELFLDSM